MGRPITSQRFVEKLYVNQHHLPTAELVDIIVKDLDVAKGTARTYISKAAKRHNEALGKPFATRRRRDDTKRARAEELFASHPTMDRSSMIKLFEQKLDMSPDSAAVHCSLVAKEFSGQHAAKM